MPVDLAMFVHSLAGGGAERAAVVLSNEIASRGFGVDLVVQHHEGPNRDLVSRSVSVVDLDCQLRRLPWKLRSYLKDVRPRTMVSFLTGFNVIAGLARPKSLRRLVVVEQNPISQSRSEQPFWERQVVPLIPMAYKRANHTVAVASSIRAELVGLGIPESRAVFIPNPVPLDRIQLESTESEYLHPFFESGVPVLISTGRLVVQKDHDTLLRAAAQLREHRDFRLLVLGEGLLRAELEGKVSALGLREVADFPGYVDPPWPWMARADLFVMSSRFEGWPLAMIEALAVGTPVISTDAPFGPSEILDRGRFGRLVPVGNPSALAQGIREVLDDPPPSELLRARADEWSVQRIADQYLQILGFAATPDK